MEKDIKKEALRQYLKYFKVWFIIAGVLAVITIGAAVVHLLTPKTAILYTYVVIGGRSCLSLIHIRLCRQENKCRNRGRPEHVKNNIITMS